MQLLTKENAIIGLSWSHQRISSCVQKSKANVEAIQALMGKFSHQAFITRKSSASTLLIFSDIEESVAKQHALITSTGEQIHKLLKVDLHALPLMLERMTGSHIVDVICTTSTILPNTSLFHYSVGEPVSAQCDRPGQHRVASLHRICGSNNSGRLHQCSTLLPTIPYGQHRCSPVHYITL